MKVYTIERYVNGLGEDCLVTDNFDDIKEFVVNTIESNHNLDFEVVTYDIPEEDAVKFHNDVYEVYENCIMNFDYYDDIGKYITNSRKYVISNY